MNWQQFPSPPLPPPFDSMHLSIHPNSKSMFPIHRN